MILPSVLDKLEFSKVLIFISKYAATEKGKSDILALKPFEESSIVSLEGKLVTEAKEILIKNVFPPIDYIPDIEESISKSRVEGTILESRKILEILKLAVTSRNLFQYLKTNSELAPSLYPLSNRLFVDKMLEHNIQKVIAESGDIKENASTKLIEIRREIRDRKDDLIRSVNRIIKKLNKEDMVREDYLTLRDGRIVIPVKAEHKRHVRGFIHSESSTGQTVYIEPEETLELNNEIVSLSFAERREVERLLRELTKRIGEESASLKKSLETVSYIDSIFARAKYSIEIIGAFPELNNSAPFEIKDARHPILLKKYGKQDTVPLNLKIEPDKKVIIITGPNAGGKTVVLKTAGLLCLMVQSGIHIPANPDSNFHFFKNILLDIGDEQSIEDDLSTFSSHLKNINDILFQADEKSLVLLDEIGTGTDPAEGSALAASVLISLKKKETVVLATTHHGNLKLIAHELPGFENAAMEFDSENLKPTYKFKQGIPGSSYAFEVARRIGFKDEFIELAKEYLDTSKHQLENFLVEIEAKSKSLEDKMKQMEIENARLTGLSSLYNKKIEQLNNEKKEILKKAKEDAEHYLKDVNKKIENAIKQIKETSASKESIKASHQAVREIKDENINLFEEEIVDEKKDFQVGDYVQIKNTLTSGKILEINKNKNFALVAVGTLKMKTKISELSSAKSKESTVSKNASNDYSPELKMRLDIRGLRAEEAEYEIIKFIDDSYSAGLERVDILHGKGTGALKKAALSILKKHDKIKNYYFAPVEFGGEGITIVEFI
jgi:DNA mismatch repair protein MutS2